MPTDATRVFGIAAELEADRCESVEMLEMRKLNDFADILDMSFSELEHTTSNTGSKSFRESALLCN